MRARVGTSGFAYKEWKGPFYPEDLPDKKRLSYYAERLDAVEINNTFYRMPRAEMLAGWTEQVPAGFTFVVKSPQRITHRARLVEVEESVALLWSAVQSLGARRGPILFQLPPYFRKEAERLRVFLAALPDGLRPVLEFRHESWRDEEVAGILRDSGAALCLADNDKDDELAPLEATADWGYLRLRRTSYSDEQLRAWAEHVRAMPWKEVFVFFKHEDGGLAPALATRFLREFAELEKGS